MANVLEQIRAKAKTLGKKICLTESDDPRNLKAAEKLVQTGYAKPILVGDADAIAVSYTHLTLPTIGFV